MFVNSGADVLHRTLSGQGGNARKKRICKRCMSIGLMRRKKRGNPNSSSLKTLKGSRHWWSEIGHILADKTGLVRNSGLSWV